jgi:hypothetical protein
MNDPSDVSVFGPIVYLIFCLAWIAAFALFGTAIFFPWMHAQSNELPVSLAKIAGMRLQGLPVGVILDAWAELRKAQNAPRLETLEDLWRSHRREVRTAADLVRIHREAAGTD